ncbi:MAG TPA: phosphoglucosamine mutase, partial [Ignavibacteria bacterium]|nr:phosphoglucosamine mutase [Ignavibacteria bacterium]
MKKGNNKIIASVSGVRGIIGDNLTPDVVVKFTSAFAAYCEKTSESRTIVVGYDGRVFGNYLYDLVNSTLSMCGYMVISMGVVPTPTVQIAAEDMKAAGGISI